MIGVDAEKDRRTGIPVSSLYGGSFESLTPAAADLADVDVLVIDLQDVGSRYYTYVWTMALAMEAAARARVTVVVARSPEPAGRRRGRVGAALPGFHSFVGLGAVPVRHGLTIGEMARMVRAGIPGDRTGRFGKADRLRAQGRGDEGLEAVDGLRRDRPALGDAVAEHADARHRVRLSRAVPGRGDQPVRGARHDAAVRDHRRAVPRRLSLGGAARPPASARRAIPAAVVPADVSQVRAAVVRRRAAARHQPRHVPSLPRRHRAAARGARAGARRLRLAHRALRVRRGPARDRSADRQRRGTDWPSTTGRPFDEICAPFAAYESQFSAQRAPFLLYD